MRPWWGGGLYLSVLPVPALEVCPAESEQEDGIDCLGSPAEGYVEPQIEDDVGDVADVDDQCAKLQREGRARVARARDGLEVDVGGHQKEVGGTHYPQGVDGGLLQIGHVGVDA